MVIAPHKAGHLLAIPGKLGGGNFAKLAAFPGYFRWQERNVVFRTTGANLDHLMRHWPEAEWIGGADEIRQQYLASLGVARETSATKVNPAVIPDDSDYRYKREPMAHQRKAFALSRDKKAFGLFMEQGTGKTKVVIDTACWLWQRKEIEALIVVAWPNGVHTNWVEYELPEDVSVPYVAEYWSANHSAKHRQVSFAKFFLAKDKLKIFTFNVEAFVSEAAQEMILRLLATYRCLLTIDQSASIKNPQAKRTKFLIDKCSGAAPYRRVMDGAPVAEGASELYSQFKFLDPWIIGHDTWTGFKAEYCEIGWFNEIKGYKNLEQLREKIDGHCFRVLASECLDLPERVYKKWVFDLAAEEGRIFSELETQDLASFTGTAFQGSEEEMNFEDSDILEEHHALTKVLRLQQIASGWWPGDEFKKIEKKSPARLQALLLLLESAPGKALIFSRFRADLDLIAKTLGDKAVSYHGGVEEEERAEAKRRFMRDPKILYFVGQPQTAGLGHTLTAAHNVVFYCNHPSLRLREECEKRAHRQGLKHILHIWDLIARKTTDSKIVRALRAKKDLADEIMRDPENFFLRHE